MFILCNCDLAVPPPPHSLSLRGPCPPALRLKASYLRPKKEKKFKLFLCVPFLERKKTFK